LQLLEFLDDNLMKHIKIINFKNLFAICSKVFIFLYQYYAKDDHKEGEQGLQIWASFADITKSVAPYHIWYVLDLKSYLKRKNTCIMIIIPE